MSSVSGLSIFVRRADAGLSRRELARRCGTSSATLAKYERGDVSPGAATLERILDGVLPRRRRWASLGALAAAAQEQFAAGNPGQAWRLCTEVIDDEHQASDE